MIKQEKKILSTIEAQVLGSIIIIDENAYGLSIIDFIKKQTGRTLGLGTVYKVLRNLKSYEFVESEDLKGTSERGGRKKTIYHPTKKGLNIYTQYFRQMEKFKNKNIVFA
jgi:PadR family transcriptional regulator PadR